MTPFTVQRYLTIILLLLLLRPTRRRHLLESDSWQTCRLLASSSLSDNGINAELDSMTN